MAERVRVVPMIYVPDVRATVDWYTSIGFFVKSAFGDGGEGLSFAILSYGTGEVMFNTGGSLKARNRRELALYVYCDDPVETYARLKDRVEIVKDLHDTFYGMREFICRGLNRFMITFGQDLPG
jgi:uncharacterized glyoxalase superfamily protein PhnB